MQVETGLRYDEDSQTILVESDEGCLELYTEASRSEFEFVEDVEQFETRASAQHDRMLNLLDHQQGLVKRGEYFERLDTLQRKTGKFYARCKNLQEQSEQANSEIIGAQIGRLYKIEKLLKHYFRCLAVAQSLGFSQRLVLQYLATHDYVYLYGFVRNTCSTIEFLGTIVENRLGNGDLQRDQRESTFKDVYEELKSQELTDVLAGAEEVKIPPTGETKRMDKMELSANSMEFLREKRNEIVHHCPLVIESDDREHLPSEIVNTSLITRTDIKKLIHLSYRLHIHSLAIFMNFSKSYLEEMIEELIDSWSTNGTPQPVN